MAEPKILMILEVSQKQAYIFSPRMLKNNCIRSEEIALVTSEAFFEKAFQDYSKDYMVYSGGGHTVMQFPDETAAKAFAEAVTMKAMRDFPDMELYVKQIAYDRSKSASENLLELSKALEEKKACRRQSFRTMSLGIEAARSESRSNREPQDEPAPAGWQWSTDVDEIVRSDKATVEDENFLAIVHLDGNSMGKRVQKVYENCSDWGSTVENLRRFSEGIANDFNRSFDEMAQDLAKSLEAKGYESRIVPLRKLILAGDDVCFLTAGSLGLECAASFLQHLSEKTNLADGEHYSACAGVVMVHKKYPFRQAYDMSEHLCSNAKVFVAKHGGDFSAVDYHIEFGQLKGELSMLRQDYRADDGTYMALRPLAVVGGKSVPEALRYDHLVATIRDFKKGSGGVARSKIKAMREAISQGELEAELALRMMNAGNLRYAGFDARNIQAMERTVKGEKLSKEIYMDLDDERRCLLFDAIELYDHVTLWKEGYHL